MTILELKKRFEEAQKSILNINCALLAGSEKISIENISKELDYLITEIEKQPVKIKNLIIANYKL